MPTVGSLAVDSLIPEFSFTVKLPPFVVLVEDKNENARPDFPLSFPKPANELNELTGALTAAVSLSAVVVVRRLAVLIIRLDISSCEAFLNSPCSSGSSSYKKYRNLDKFIKKKMLESHYLYLIPVVMI